jgi:hypothetical protein
MMTKLIIVDASAQTLAQLKMRLAPLLLQRATVWARAIADGPFRAARHMDTPPGWVMAAGQ